MAEFTPHVSDFKKKVVSELVQLFKEYPIVGSLNMLNLPAQQLQIIAAKLREKCEFRMTKRRLMVKAIEQAKVEGLEKIIPHLKGMPSLLFTKENPFALFRTIKQNKSKAPAKAGQIAPNDIKIPAGPTPFAPGPVIGELGALGIKSKVDAGKINILEDTIVCKEGEKISEQLASMLTRLSILPMEVGLDVTAVFENGEILEKSILDNDEEAFDRDLDTAITYALNLSVEVGYTTTDNIELMIGKAFRDARGVAQECGIITSELIEDYLVQGTREAGVLVSEFGIDLAPEEKKEEPKVEKKEEPKVEEPKVEEKKEEPKVEEKKEEPKVEEKPKEEVKPETVEEKKEEPKEQEIKVEEVKEPPKPPKVVETPAEKQETKKFEAAGIQAHEVTPEQVEEAKKKMEENVEKEKKQKEMDEVAELAKKLVKKGTLRSKNKL